VQSLRSKRPVRRIESPSYQLGTNYSAAWVKYRFVSWILIFESSYIILRYIFNAVLILLGSQADPITIATEGVWLVCAFTVMSSVYSFRGGNSGFNKVLVLWDTLLEECEKLLPKSEFEKTLKEENYFIKGILIFYIYSTFSAAFGVASYFMTYPENTMFIYNLFFFHAWIPNPNLRSIIQTFFIPHEFLWVVISVTGQFAPEAFLILFARRVNLNLRALEFVTEEGIQTPGKSMKDYKRMQRVLIEVNEVSKWWIYRLQYIIICFVTVIVYMCVRSFSKIPFLAQSTFVTSSAMGIVRNSTLLTSMGAANSRSRNLLRIYSYTVSHGFGKKNLRSLKPLEFKNGSFYFIDSCSTMQFLDYSCSQLISCLNMF